MTYKKSIGNLIRKVHHGMIRFSFMGEQKERITPPQGMILGYLSKNSNQDVYQRDLEKVLEVSRATMTNMLTTMQKHGLIERKPVEHDARLKKIVLTEKSELMNEQIISKLRELEESMVAGISEDELKQFYETLSKINENLKELLPAKDVTNKKCQIDRGGK